MQYRFKFFQTVLFIIQLTKEQRVFVITTSTKIGSSKQVQNLFADTFLIDVPQENGRKYQEEGTSLNLNRVRPRRITVKIKENIKNVRRS